MDHAKSSLSASSLAEDGFALVPNLLSAPHLQELLHLCSSLQSPRGRGGIRNLDGHIPQLAGWLSDSGVEGLVQAALGLSAQRVRSIFFDKTPDNNWKVPWHQDLAIAVQERHEVSGYSAWSIKQGVPHVHPPAQLLEQCLTVRIHLDACPSSNGALRVIPGSHLHGLLSPQRVRELTGSRAALECELPAGGILLMRPLLLHASSPARQGYSHRRVVHLEYASQPPAAPLKWRNLVDSDYTRMNCSAY